MDCLNVNGLFFSVLSEIGEFWNFSWVVMEESFDLCPADVYVYNVYLMDKN